MPIFQSFRKLVSCSQTPVCHALVSKRSSRFSFANVGSWRGWFASPELKKLTTFFIERFEQPLGVMHVDGCRRSGRTLFGNVFPSFTYSWTARSFSLRTITRGTNTLDESYFDVSRFPRLTPYLYNMYMCIYASPVHVSYSDWMNATQKSTGSVWSNMCETVDVPTRIPRTRKIRRCAVHVPLLCLSWKRRI